MTHHKSTRKNYRIDGAERVQFEWNKQLVNALQFGAEFRLVVINLVFIDYLLPPQRSQIP